MKDDICAVQWKRVTKCDSWCDTDTDDDNEKSDDDDYILL